MDDKTVKRWYDRDVRLAKILEKIRYSSSDVQNNFARILIELLQAQRSLNKLKKDSHLISLGAEKVLNLYKACNKRRWYDKSSILSYPLNILSTLPNDDFKKIVDELALIYKSIID